MLIVWCGEISESGKWRPEGSLNGSANKQRHQLLRYNITFSQFSVLLRLLFVILGEIYQILLGQFVRFYCPNCCACVFAFLLEVGF